MNKIRQGVNNIFDLRNIHLFGISHKTAPVNIRERFSFGRDTIPSVLKQIKALEGVKECVVVSTCNRTEVYAVASKDFHKNIVDFMKKSTGFNDLFSGCFYFLEDEKAVKHLFSVASGLDSMIIGETQILGQIKDSYSMACDQESTWTMLNRLFHLSFRVAKRVRSETSIGEGAVSAGSAAVRLLRKTAGDIGSKSVLVIGAGKIGRVCAKQLMDSGMKEMYITNRTMEKAVCLSKDLKCSAVPFQNINEYILKADIVIASVSAESPLITKALLEKQAPLREKRSLILIDLAVPRMIDPHTQELENVERFDIDDLEDVIEKNHSKRLEEGKKAEKIIDEYVKQYSDWVSHQEMIPAISNLREKYDNIRLSELGRISNKVNTETYEITDMVTRRIIRKILHAPTVNMRTSASGEMRKKFIESINELFISDFDGS